MSHTGTGARFFAWMLAHATGPLEKTYGAIKEELFQDLEGRVLEIGPGAGINFRHYPKRVEVIGVEPNPHLHRHLRQAAGDADIPLIIYPASAEVMELEQGAVDAVVSTLVLCSVDNVQEVLAEVHRVLKPGGTFVFIEHVAAPPGSWLRRVQDVCTPLWQTFGDGCRPNCDTGRAIECAGFASVEYRQERLPGIPVVAPHIIGVARKG